MSISTETMQMMIQKVADATEYLGDLPKAHALRQMAQGKVEVDVDLYNSAKAEAVYRLEVRRRQAVTLLDSLLAE